MASNLPPTQKENWAPNEVVKPEHTNSWGSAINKLTTAMPLYASNGNYYEVQSFSDNIINLVPITYDDGTQNQVIQSYVDGMHVNFKSTFNNTEQCLVNIDNLGAKQIKTLTNENLIANSISSGYFVELIYNKENDIFYLLESRPANTDLSNLTETGKENILNMIYPIGSIYMSINEVNPSILFGFGEWEQIKDTFLLASGDNYSLASIGGEATHSLTVEEMPSHTHSASTNNTGEHSHSRGSMEITGTLGHPISRNTEARYGGFSYVQSAFQASNKTTHIGYYSNTSSNSSYAHDVNFYASRSWGGATSTNGSHAHTVTVGNTGNSNNHNNMPPYLAVNIWKRIA